MRKLCDDYSKRKLWSLLKNIVRRSSNVIVIRQLDCGFLYRIVFYSAARHYIVSESMAFLGRKTFVSATDLHLSTSNFKL